MDFLTSPNVLSTGLLVAAALCYKEAWTPPTAKADDSIRVESNVGRILSKGYSRKLSSITKSVFFSFPHPCKPNLSDLDTSSSLTF
jgi:hypothetical protein